MEDRALGREPDGQPFGWRPDGSLLRDGAELPDFAPPSLLAVGRDFYRIDGWGFSCHRVPKVSLRWLKRTADRWLALDPGPDNQC